MSWGTMPLLDCCKVSTGKYDANHGKDDGTYPFYTCADKPIKANTYSFDGDSIILPGNGANVGLVLFYSGKFEAYQRTYILNSFEAHIDSRYVYHHLNKYWKLRNERAQFGSATNYIRMQNFEDYEIPLPYPEDPKKSLKEQKRIAAILDKADAIRRKRQQAIQLADEFLRAVFLDMFGDPVTNPKGWDVKPLKKLSTVTTGNTPSRKETKFYGDHIEWIKSDNINTPSHFLTSATEYLSEEGKAVGRFVPSGSILVTCIAGSFDCIGNVAYADREVAFNQQINALTPKDEVSSWFLYALILFSKKHIQAASTNSMKGMVSKGKMEEISCICPPAPLQKRFEEIFLKFLSSNNTMDFALSASGEIFSAISQKAFAGQL